MPCCRGPEVTAAQGSRASQARATATVEKVAEQARQGTVSSPVGGCRGRTRRRTASACHSRSYVLGAAGSRARAELLTAFRASTTLFWRVGRSPSAGRLYEGGLSPFGTAASMSAAATDFD